MEAHGWQQGVPVGFIIECMGNRPVLLPEGLVQKMMKDLAPNVILSFAADLATDVQEELGDAAATHKFIAYLNRFKDDTTCPQPDYVGGQPLPPPPPPPPTATGTDQSGGTAVASPAAEDDKKDTQREERHSPAEPGNGAVETDGNQEPGTAVASPAAEDDKKDNQAEDDKKDTPPEERHSPTEPGSGLQKQMATRRANSPQNRSPTARLQRRSTSTTHQPEQRQQPRLRRQQRRPR